jgi:malonyl-CoA/methylmalonyl-CoA synthetase
VCPNIYFMGYSGVVRFGELRVAGPAMFAGYWGKPDATASSYDAEGFFCTGDTVVRQGGSWRILGRTSVDIIKCGGYKLSALEIEAHLLEHPAIGEAAVVGLPDEAYGQVVAAVLAGKGDAPPPSLAELRVWARDVLAPYKVPSQLRVVDAIPRNAMGKVNKKELAKFFDK